MSEERIEIAEGVVWTRVEAEIIAIDPQSERFFGVQGAGLTVWEALVAGTTRAEAVAAVTTRYAVSEERAAADIDRLLGELAARGLIRRPGDPAAG